MQFKIHELDNGKLDITAETKEEVVQIIQHFKLDLLQHAHVIGQDTFTYTEKAAKAHNGQWFQDYVLVQPEFTEPYRKLVEKWTGYDGPWDLQLPTIGPHGGRLGYSYYMLEAHLKPDGVAHHKLIVHSSDWNGSTAAARAGRSCQSHAEIWWGEQIHNPEYIDDNFGRKIRNPKFMRINPPTPRLSNIPLARAMFTWWLQNKATRNQREYWEASDNLHRQNTRTDTVDGLMRFDRVIRCNWKDQGLTPEQFINI